MRIRNVTMWAVASCALLLLVGCQPDQRPEDWRVDPEPDSGDMADVDDGPWAGPWSQLPSVRGGQAYMKLGESVVAARGSEPDLSIARVTEDGQTWSTPAEGTLASKIVAGRHPSFAQTDGAQYVVARDGSTTRVFQADADGTGAREIDGFDGLAAPSSIHSMSGRLMVANLEGLFLRGVDGAWEEISPSSDFGRFPEVEVAGSTILAKSAGSKGLFVSNDRGQSWRRPTFERELRRDLFNVSQLDGELFSIAVEFDGEVEGQTQRDSFLMRSTDGHSWSSTRLDVSSRLEPGSLATLQGNLYGLDAHSRLVQISAGDASTEIVVDPDFEAHTIEHRLYVVGSTLLTSLGEEHGAILTWTPGDDEWNLAQAATSNPTTFQSASGTLWAQSTVFETLGPEGEGWMKSNTQTSMRIRTAEDLLVGFDESGCLHLRQSGDWAPRLHITESGPAAGCDSSNAVSAFADAVTFKDGLAIGFHDGLVGSGGHLVNPQGQGGLVFWNPRTDETQSLVPASARSTNRPQVTDVASADGTLWVETNSDQGLPGDDATFYRVEGADWQGIQPSLELPDGRRLDAHAVHMRRFRGYADLYAVLGFDPATGPASKLRFGRWDPTAGTFRALTPPSEEVVQRSLTDIGPVAISPRGAWFYSVDSQSWIRAGQTLPFNGRAVSAVTSDTSAIYVVTEDGHVWVTRADDA